MVVLRRGVTRSSRIFFIRCRLYTLSYPENFSLLWGIVSIQLMCFKWRPFWTPPWISFKAPGEFSKTFSMLFCSYFRSTMENVSLLLAISSIQLMFSFKWRPFWESILDFLDALERFFRTFSMLFCPYFLNYTENVSLLWAISSRELGFIGSSSGILGDF